MTADRWRNFRHQLRALVVRLGSPPQTTSEKRDPTRALRRSLALGGRAYIGQGLPMFGDKRPRLGTTGSSVRDP